MKKLCGAKRHQLRFKKNDNGFFVPRHEDKMRREPGMSFRQMKGNQTLDRDSVYF